MHRKTAGRVRRTTYRNHPELWRNGPFAGVTKCKDEHQGDVCQLTTGHKARHHGKRSRWNHAR